MPMALLAPLLGAGISGLAGFFGGGKQQTVNNNNNVNQSTTGSQSGTFSNNGQSGFGNFSSSTPNLNPFQQQLAQMFTGGAEKLWNQSQDMGGYTSSGLEGINANSRNSSQAIDASLANRGLSYSPAAGTADVQNELNRTGQANQFMQGVPLLQRQLQQQSLQQLMQAFQTQPYGTTTVGGGTGTSSQTGNQQLNSQSNTTGTSTGQQTTYGNPMGGLFGGLGAGLMGGLPGLGQIFGGGGGGGSSWRPEYGTGG